MGVKTCCSRIIKMSIQEAISRYRVYLVSAVNSTQGSFLIVSIDWVQNTVKMSDWQVTPNESDAKYQALN